MADQERHPLTLLRQLLGTQKVTEMVAGDGGGYRLSVPKATAEFLYDYLRDPKHLGSDVIRLDLREKDTILGAYIFISPNIATNKQALGWLNKTTTGGMMQYLDNRQHEVMEARAKAAMQEKIAQIVIESQQTQEPPIPLTPEQRAEAAVNNLFGASNVTIQSREIKVLWPNERIMALAKILATDEFLGANSTSKLGKKNAYETELIIPKAFMNDPAIIERLEAISRGRLMEKIAKTILPTKSPNHQEKLKSKSLNAKQQAMDALKGQLQRTIKIPFHGQVHPQKDEFFVKSASGIPANHDTIRNLLNKFYDNTIQVSFDNDKKLTVQGSTKTTLVFEKNEGTFSKKIVPLIPEEMLRATWRINHGKTGGFSRGGEDSGRPNDPREGG